ncbi:MAG TPA: excinuclease ABC subunit UvrC [Candidatus Cybelea sp.]|nr:excinuclease ABC subunit UvrC [Candidatus Cybelea sp.]
MSATDNETPRTVPEPETHEARGLDVIRQHLKTLPNRPGVYRMLDPAGAPLYVGKAKSLRKRVAAYAKPAGLSGRIHRMVMETAALEIITTHTEVEALLLEANLIKRLKPRYNVVLRDDKSFPYILITGDHAWPQIAKHRGARNRPGEYFGPFASAGAVNRTLAALQRAFPLRSCSDADFATRTRPCLQYQIKRCTAPCVARIAPEAYGAIVGEARDFLSGKSQDIQRQLSAKMQTASAAMDFETAAVFRDRLRALAHIQAHQDINVESVAEADVIAAHVEAGLVCVQVFFFRAGQNFGNRAYFPAHARDVDIAEVLTAFIGQFYDTRPAPQQVLLSHAVEAPELIGEALSVGAGRKVEVLAPQRGAKRALVEHALTNAREAIARRLAENTTQRRLLEGVAEVFGLESTPERIEVYDNSHVQGSAPVGAMIVAGPEGFSKSAYRKFNIRDREIAPGDDYAMLREVLTRRFTRLLKDQAGDGAGAEGSLAENRRVAGQWPDLVLIDGGKGQLGVAEQVFAELRIDDVALAAIAKGPDRNAGREQFFLPGREPFALEPRHPVLYFLQRLRDEAHRFAIGTHRTRRGKLATRSALDEIPGIGSKRKQALLMRFGSARGVEAAGLTDLETVDGISKAVAQVIYRHFHGS